MAIHSDMVLVRHQVHPLVGQAYEDSQKFHDGQVRKYTGAPYWTHTREVAAILIRCGIEDPEMLCAAHGHDWLEDTDAEPDYIVKTYGQVVFNLIFGLTDIVQRGNRAARKKAQAEWLWKACGQVQTIKCADLISNTADIVPHDPGFAKVYIAEKRYVLSGFTQADPVVYAWACRSLLQAEDALAKS